MKKLILLCSIFISITAMALGQVKDSSNNKNNDDFILMIGGGVGHLNANVEGNGFYHKNDNIPTFNIAIINDIKLSEQSPWRMRVGADIVNFRQTMINPSKAASGDEYFIKNKLNQSFVSVSLEAAYDWYVGGKSKALIRPHAGFGFSIFSSNISNTKVNPTASIDYPNVAGVTSDYVTEKNHENRLSFGTMFVAGITFAPIPSLPNLMFDISCSQQLIRSGWVGTKTMVNNNYNNKDHVKDYLYQNNSMMGNLALMVGYHINLSK